MAGQTSPPLLRLRRVPSLTLTTAALLVAHTFQVVSAAVCGPSPRVAAAAFLCHNRQVRRDREIATRWGIRRLSFNQLSAEASPRHVSSLADGATTTSAPSSSPQDPLGLTPELRKLTNAFEAIGDDKLRYKQLLYMANQLAPMDEANKVPENKVPGCLSTVHVHATIDPTAPPVVQFTGDSDGLLTKGLVALLVRGLSGNTAQAIQAVDPTFIQQAGIAASLTPGRNNGFLNMLSVMKKKALEAEAAVETTGATTESAHPSTAAQSMSSSGRPKYDAMVEALKRLQPVKLELVDNSHQHAGHAGASPEGESHFDLHIVADAFEGLNLVKRHKLVYMMLGDIMPHIHALQIRAQTPSEAGL